MNQGHHGRVRLHMTPKPVARIKHQFGAIKLGSGLLTTLLVVPVLKWIIQKSR